MKSVIRASVLLFVSLGVVQHVCAQPFDGYATFTRDGGMYFQATSVTAAQPAGAGTWESG